MMDDYIPILVKKTHTLENLTYSYTTEKDMMSHETKLETCYECNSPYFIQVKIVRDDLVFPDGKPILTKDKKLLDPEETIQFVCAVCGEDGGNYIYPETLDDKVVSTPTPIRTRVPVPTIYDQYNKDDKRKKVKRRNEKK